MNFLLLFFMALNAQATGQKVGQFVGHESLSNQIKSRMLKPDKHFHVEMILPGMNKFLGQFGGFGDKNNFKNGDPNALNMSLYHLLLEGMSKEMVGFCSSIIKSEIALSSEFESKLNKVCEWKQASDFDGPLLSSLYFHVMGLGGDELLRKSWLAFMKNSFEKNLNSKDSLQQGLFVLFMQPDFLLKR